MGMKSKDSGKSFLALAAEHGAPYYSPEPSWSEDRREAFLIYRDMPYTSEGETYGKRSIERLSKQLGHAGAVRQYEQWSRDGDWGARCRAWDKKVDDERQEAYLAETRRASARHAKYASKIQRAAMESVDALLKRFERAVEEGVDPFTKEDIKLRDLQAMLIATARVMPGIMQMERLARGLSTHNVAVDDATDARRKVEEMTPEAVRAQLAGVDDGSGEVVDGEVVEG